VIGNKSALPSDDLFSLSGIYNAVRKAVASVLRYVGMWAPEAKAQKMVTVETQDEDLATAITNLSLKSVGRGITTNIRTSSGQSVWISNGFKDRVNESREGNIRMSETLTRLAQLVRDISPEQCRIKAHLQELQQKALQKKALQKGQS
jgi:hypothetical protein